MPPPIEPDKNYSKQPKISPMSKMHILRNSESSINLINVFLKFVWEVHVG